MRISVKEKLYLSFIALFSIGILLVAAVGLRSNEPPFFATPVSAEPETEVVIREVEKWVEVEKFVEVEKEVTAEILEDGLRDLGTLVTREYNFTEVIGYSSVKKFLKTDITLPFTESSYLASYDGTVTAGIDFTGIQVQQSEDRLIIQLPKAEILTVDIDPESFVLYSEKSGIGNPVSAADFNQSLVTLEANARSKALTKGLLGSADENARVIVRNFITSLMGPELPTLEFT